MTTTTNAGIVLSYTLFMSIMLFLTPFFAPDLFNVVQTDINTISQPVTAGIFEVVIGFINNVIVRATVLLSIATSGTLIGIIIGIFVGAYSIGFFWALAMLIAEALP